MARTPNRIQIPFIVDTLLPFEEKTTKTERKLPVPVEGAKVTVFNRETETPANVYTSEKGEALLSPIETNAKGEIPGWIEEGAYRLTIKEGTPSVAEKNLFWDAVSGRGVEHISEYSGSIESGPGKTVKERELEEKVVNALVPVGTVFAFAGDAAPPGYLICDGSEFENKLHKKLSETLGTKYGSAVKGVEWTKLPNLKGRNPVGKDTGREALKGTHPNMVGESGGESEVKLTEGQMPKHAHGGATGTGSTGTANTSTESAFHQHGGTTEAVTVTSDLEANFLMGAAAGGFYGFGQGSGLVGIWRANINYHAHAHNFGTGNNNASHVHLAGPLSVPALSIAAAGNNEVHENMTPYVVTNYIIKAD